MYFLLLTIAQTKENSMHIQRDGLRGGMGMRLAQLYTCHLYLARSLALIVVQAFVSELLWPIDMHNMNHIEVN